MGIASCANKHAPVISRPDNLVIECTTGCKFSIPMNTEIMVARNTNGWDALKTGFAQIPIVGALLLSWKSLDVAENIADKAIASFNKGAANVTTTTTTGDTITTTTGDTITTSGDTDSGNTSSGDVATTSGDDIGGDKAGGDIDKSVSTITESTESIDSHDLEYNNSYNDQSTVQAPLVP